MSDKIIKYENLEHRISMDNILTPEQIIYPGMRVLLIAGNRIEAVKILVISYTCETISIQVSRLRDNKYFEISHVIEPLNNHYVWWLISYEYIMNFVEDRVMDQLEGN